MFLYVRMYICMYVAVKECVYVKALPFLLHHPYTSLSSFPRFAYLPNGMLPLTFFRLEMYTAKETSEACEDESYKDEHWQLTTCHL